MSGWPGLRNKGLSDGSDTGKVADTGCQTVKDPLATPSPLHCDAGYVRCVSVSSAS
jgi:hypothetical protein